MKAVVTGGAGFIGSHVVERLINDGYEVVVIDNFSTGHRNNIEPFQRKIDIVEADISNNNGWKSKFDQAEVVFHLAALADIVPSIKKPEEYFFANVNGTFNVVQASRLYHAKRFIYAASSSCYGISENFPTSESDLIDPQYPYALTKYLGEELVMHWAKVYNLPAISLRFFNVYGPRSRTSGTYGAMFGVFLAQKLAGKPFTIVGDGTQTRDFTYVTDVVDAIISAARSDYKNIVFNVGSGATISVNRVVELLEGERVYIPKRPGEPECTFADISLIKEKLNWCPKVSIENGIKFLLEEIDYWKDAPVWDETSIAEATNDWFKFLGSRK
tara:strand:- start:364 stop:1350 length:987 start_codon:yes stop_codon:yes gene_type:complete